MTGPQITTNSASTSVSLEEALPFVQRSGSEISHPRRFSVRPPADSVRETTTSNATNSSHRAQGTQQMSPPSNSETERPAKKSRIALESSDTTHLRALKFKKMKPAASAASSNVEPNPSSSRLAVVSPKRTYTSQRGRPKPTARHPQTVGSLADAINLQQIHNSHIMREAHRDSLQSSESPEPILPRVPKARRRARTTYTVPDDETSDDDASPSQVAVSSGPTSTSIDSRRPCDSPVGTSGILEPTSSVNDASTSHDEPITMDVEDGPSQMPEVSNPVPDPADITRTEGDEQPVLAFKALTDRVARLEADSHQKADSRRKDTDNAQQIAGAVVNEIGQIFLQGHTNLHPQSGRGRGSWAPRSNRAPYYNPHPQNYNHPGESLHGLSTVNVHSWCA